LPDAVGDESRRRVDDLSRCTHPVPDDDRGLESII
jgi:hypothetical protein